MPSPSTPPPPYDLVVVDEASQALLGMLAAAKALGKHNVWVGDVKQLPPVVACDEDRINAAGMGPLVDGLRSLTTCGSYAVYQLTRSHRLPLRAARYTGFFYNNTLLSTRDRHMSVRLPGYPTTLGRVFSSGGGPKLAVGAHGCW